MPDEQSPGSKYQKGVLYDIPVSDLKTDPNQPRKYLDPQALEDLTTSIAQHGVLTPILFRVAPAATAPAPASAPDAAPPAPDAAAPTLYIVAGERRCEAARAAGLTTIPGLLVEGKTGEIALVENLLRQDLTAVEEAEALDRLTKEEGYTQEQLGAVIGKARTTVGDILTLNRLPQEIRDECRTDPSVTRKTLIAIARKKQARAMITAWNKYKEKAAKEAAGKQPRTRKTETPEEVAKWLAKATTRLDALDTTTWTADEKSALHQTLLDLEETIQARLSALEGDDEAPEGTEEA
ncbi:MAG TPA: ParB/RepB/Spo0J family partition protein [Syntrophales bacterium]|nr:ParB/RepB/Spo0J family partition protein [Syntrophales bacterium]